jgi:hypothetical protein
MRLCAWCRRLIYDVAYCDSCPGKLYCMQCLNVYRENPDIQYNMFCPRHLISRGEVQYMYLCYQCKYKLFSPNSNRNRCPLCCCRMSNLNQWNVCGYLAGVLFYRDLIQYSQESKNKPSPQALRYIRPLLRFSFSPIYFCYVRPLQHVGVFRIYT